MSDGDQDKPEEPDIGQAIELQPNPALGILRFLLWLAPTGILVLCLFLSASGLVNYYIGRSFLSVLGIGLFCFCAWFDSQIALPCRIGKRSSGTHLAIYMLTQIVLVVPALLFAIAYAICAAL
ncbi:hypothetical protein ACFQY0_13265 [Haloferula chungangensis]|uniref:Integron gene cassette protein n=1 Tax=Haloferula chungangensis TaxID=1048331 RepID=A0ABW2L722_9BACT